MISSYDREQTLLDLALGRSAALRLLLEWLLFNSSLPLSDFVSDAQLRKVDLRWSA